MTLRSLSELEATREKLKLLQQRYDATRDESPQDAHVQELTLRSLKQLINQLKEEITRFESHTLTE